MKCIPIRIFAAVSALLAMETQVFGQSARLGVGVGAYPFGVWGPGPYFGAPWWWGGYPAAVGSFWTNGLSLYGPPVPSYGVVPGSFGGSDAHRFLVTPPVGTGIYGVGIYSYRDLSQRSRTTSGLATSGVVPVPVAEMKSVAFGGQPASSLKKARLTIKLPHPDAKLWIDQSSTKLSGSERVFESPDLIEGQDYEYRLIAMWVNDSGEEVSRSRIVPVRAGQSMIIDFNIAE